MGRRLQWKQLKTKQYESKTVIQKKVEMISKFHLDIMEDTSVLLNGLNEDKRLKIDLVTLLLQLKYHRTPMTPMLKKR